MNTLIRAQINPSDLLINTDQSLKTMGATQ